MKKRGPAPKRYRYNGKLYSMEQLADMAGVPLGTMYARIKYYGFTVARAVETPKPRRGTKPDRHTYAGRSLTLSEWSKLSGIPAKTLNRRISSYGWTIEQALCFPSLEQRRRGVVFNFMPSKGTGAGSTAQEIPEITFSEQAETQ